MTQLDDARQQFRDADGQQWSRIDLALLVQEPRFSHVGLI
jgi:twitching motility protein PilI